MVMYYLIRHGRMIMVAREKWSEITNKGLGKSWSQSRSSFGPGASWGRWGLPMGDLWDRA